MLPHQPRGGSQPKLTVSAGPRDFHLRRKSELKERPKTQNNSTALTRMVPRLQLDGLWVSSPGSEGTILDSEEILPDHPKALLSDLPVGEGESHQPVVRSDIHDVPTPVRLSKSCSEGELRLPQRSTEGVPKRFQWPMPGIDEVHDAGAQAVRSCYEALLAKGSAAAALEADTKHSAHALREIHQAIEALQQCRIRSSGEGPSEQETNMKVMYERLSLSLQRDLSRLKQLQEEIDMLSLLCSGEAMSVLDSHLRDEVAKKRVAEQTAQKQAQKEQAYDEAKMQFEADEAAAKKLAEKEAAQCQRQAQDALPSPSPSPSPSPPPFRIAATAQPMSPQISQAARLARTQSMPQFSPLASSPHGLPVPQGAVVQSRAVVQQNCQTQPICSRTPVTRISSNVTANVIVGGSTIGTVQPRNAHGAVRFSSSGVVPDCATVNGGKFVVRFT